VSEAKSDIKNCWFVYIVRCSDNSLYTGITTDLDRRIDEHNHGKKAAAYTRSRRPVKLVYQEKCKTRSEATLREAMLRKLGKTGKERLISRPVP